MLNEIKALIGSGYNIYIGNLPDAPDDVVGLFHSGGYNPDLSGSCVREPTFMVKVRNSSYSAGLTVCEDISEKLHGVVHNGNFLLIAQEGDINDLGRDNNNRQEWSLNFRTYYN